MAITVVFSHKI